MVIYIAGILSIPQDTSRRSRSTAAALARFRYVIVPLSRPATFTVILLSFIGGLRTFDLIWTMTRGGPGFTTDVLASTIYKQYQAASTACRRPATSCCSSSSPLLVYPAASASSIAQGARAVRLRSAQRTGWTPSRSSSSASSSSFRSSFIVLTAVKDRGQRPPSSTSPGRANGRSGTTSPRSSTTATTCWSRRCRNSSCSPSSRSRSSSCSAAMVGFVLQRRRDRMVGLANVAGARRADHPARRRADDLRAAGDRPVQDADRADPGRGRLHPAVRGACLSRASSRPSPARSTRPRSSTAPALQPVLLSHLAAAAAGA